MPPPKKTALQHVTCANLSHLSIDHIDSFIPEQFTSTLILFEPKQWTIQWKSLKITMYRLARCFSPPPEWHDHDVQTVAKSDGFPCNLFILMCYLHGTLDEHRLRVRQGFHRFRSESLRWCKWKQWKYGWWKVCKQSTGSLGPPMRTSDSLQGGFPWLKNT